MVQINVVEHPNPIFVTENGCSGEKYGPGSRLYTTSWLGVVDGDLDLHAWLDADRGDLLDDIGGGVQVDEALVDPETGAVVERV